MRITTRGLVPCLAALGAAAALVLTPAPAQAGEPVVDGRSAATAAASCWEVKQRDPSAPSGTYWLITPTLQAPTRFSCDMTTDGGGWVLLGRGRDAWSNGGDGKGTPAQVAAQVQGVEAFSARQLSHHVITGLLDGGRVDALPDGIRIRRASSTAGTSWQEIRLALAERGRWTWAFDAKHPLARYTVDGTATTRKQTTADATTGTEKQRLVTTLTTKNGWRRGFNYPATGPAGSTSESSHLYSTASGGGYATPFAQVWIRPRLTTATRTYPRVPAAGTAQQVAPALPESWGLPSEWGVSGQGKGGTDKDYATEVSAFAQSGNRVYVGGNFTTVRRGADGVTHDQPYLAAFDATTGAWIPSFRPRLNHQVKALTVLPDGRLVVGGQFTKVGSESRSGLAVVDPTTGAPDPQWRAQVRQTRKEKMWVRALAVHGGRLYVGGAFTHVRSSPSTPWRALDNLARVDAAKGTVDTAWFPNLGGAAKNADGKPAGGTSVTDLSFNADGSTVHAVGYFQSGFIGKEGKATVSQPHMAAISTAKKAAFGSWTRSYSKGSATNRRYQFAVEDVGSRIYVGGSQHSIFGYSSAYKRVSASITLRGGDMQALASRRGIVYGSCHCADFAYASPNLSSAGFTEGDAINYVGAWDAATGAYLPAFSPVSVTRGGEGAWALLTAKDGTLWAGGSYTSVVGRSGTRQWAGGFVRFPPRPATAPRPPSGLTATASGSTAQLSWTGSPDADVVHEVLRDGKVVALTSGTTASVPIAGATSGFVVRAHDGAENRSASTPVRTVAAG